MKKNMLKVTFLLLSVIAFSSNTNATIIVSGDATIALSLNSKLIPYFSAGDQQFFENILSGTTDIAILDQSGTNVYANQINQFYKSLGDINLSTTASVTAASVANTDMLIIPLPKSMFSNDEMVIMNSYIQGGGSVFFLGESLNSSINNLIINQMLLGIGSSMSIENNILDPGPNISSAVGAQKVEGNPYTDNVFNFKYAQVSSVNGGNPLFLTTGMTPFIAYEPSNSVPEPSMVLLFLITIPGLLLIRKKN